MMFVVPNITLCAEKVPNSASDTQHLECRLVCQRFSSQCLLFPWTQVFPLHCTPERICSCSSPSCIPLLLLVDICQPGEMRWRWGIPFDVLVMPPFQSGRGFQVSGVWTYQHSRFIFLCPYHRGNSFPHCPRVSVFVAFPPGDLEIQDIFIGKIREMCMDRISQVVAVLSQSPVREFPGVPSCFL